VVVGEIKKREKERRKRERKYCKINCRLVVASDQFKLQCPAVGPDAEFSSDDRPM
jgi:hypothetical protein